MKTIIDDGVWTWFNDPRAIFLNENVALIGYVRSDGNPGLARYEFSRDSVSHVNLGTKLSLQRDDHNNPGIIKIADGRILIAYSRHNNDTSFFYRISNNSDPIVETDWSDEIAVYRSDKTTYANLVSLGSEQETILNFHRCINWNPTLSIFDVERKSWGNPMHVIKTGEGRVRPYFKVWSGRTGRVDILYTDHHPNNFDNSIYHCFLENGVFHSSDGLFLGMANEGPLDHDSGVRGSCVYQFRAQTLGVEDSVDDWIPGGRAWVWDLALSDEGHPVCVFSVCRRGKDTDFMGDRIWYYWAQYRENRWEKKCIASAGRPLYDKERDYAGGICLDKNNTHKCYLSTNASSPFGIDSSPAHDNGSIEIETTNSLFEVFIGEHGDITNFSKIEGVVNAIRPYVLKSDGGRSLLLWLDGVYENYKSYKTKINGMFIN